MAEELLVKVVADGLDVFQGVLLGLAQERRSTTEPVGTVSNYDLDANSYIQLFSICENVLLLLLDS